MKKRNSKRGILLMSDNGGSYNTVHIKKRQTTSSSSSVFISEQPTSSSDFNTQINNEKSTSPNSNIFIQEETSSNLDFNTQIEPWITDMEALVELPIPNLRNVQLSGSFDDTQAFVINDKSLVIIKKVSFKDSEKFISGCSSCHNLNSDFLLYLEASSLYDSEMRSALLVCEHVKDAISLLYSNLKCWKSSVSETQMQSFLHENCNWQNESCFFVSSSCSKFCGSLSPQDGIILFEKKNAVWRCTFCKCAPANKCHHGQIIWTDHGQTLPENEIDVLTAPKSLNGQHVKLLSTQAFSG